LPTRDITLDVTIRARTADADKAAAALKRVDEQAAHAGRSMQGMTGDSKILNAEIKKSEQTIKDLDKVLLEFGNDKSVRQRLRGERSWLADLKRMEKDLTPAAHQAGVTVGSSFGKGISGALTDIGGSGGPILIGALVGAVIAAAPTIGAVVGGALAGAVGTGAMALGIISAAKDDRVRAAARKFGDDVSAELFRGDAFVTPVIRALAILRNGLRSLNLSGSLAKVAPTVDIIARGFVSLAQNIMPGLNKALDRMGPFANAASRGLAQTGSALGYLLDRVTSSKGAVEGLSTMFHILNGSIRALGLTILVLSNIYEQWVKIERIALAEAEGFALVLGQIKLAEQLHNIGRGLDEMMNNAGPTANAVGDVTVGVQSFGEAASLAAVAQGRLNSALEKGHQDFLSFMGADIGAEAALDRFTEGVREHGRSLDKNTEIGRENLTNLLDLARAAQDAAEKKYEETKSVQDANAVYETYRQRLEAQLKVLGYTKAEIKQIIDAWFGLAAAPDINKDLNIHINTIGSMPQIAKNLSLEDRLEPRAAGGPVVAGGGYLVGENGPERFYPATNGYIDPKSSASPTTLVIRYDTSGAMDDLARLLRKWVRIEGGTGADSVQLALGA